MKFTFGSKPSKNSLLIYTIFEKETVRDKALSRLVSDLKAVREFEGKEGQTFFLFPKRMILVGCGILPAGEKKLSAEFVMGTVSSAVKAAASHYPQKISFHFPAHFVNFAQAVGEAFVLASYQPSAPFKTGKASKKLKEQRIETVEFVGVKENKTRAALQQGLKIANVVNEVRDWVNAGPNISSAQFFDEKAEEIAKQTGAKLTIMRKKELEKLNMGALLGVNRGSPDEARLTILDYTPKNADPKKPPLVFAGKGILFDSGGYNIKTRGHIEDMQLDKAGAAAVLALMKLLPTLSQSRRVIGVMPFTENLIGSRALKPSEIIKTYSGKTIEITNTDAEGRLVLADAVAYAVDVYKPELIVDVATLTGACMVALGYRYAGLFGNNKELTEKLRAAGDAVDEKLWPLPLDKEHTEKVKSFYADLHNADPQGEGLSGASKGAAFIQEFVGKTHWAHIDIAGPAFTKDPKKYEAKGATGFGVRTLMKFLENY